jgi:hypothetical protein
MLRNMTVLHEPRNAGGLWGRGSRLGVVNLRDGVQRVHGSGRRRLVGQRAFCGEALLRNARAAFLAGWTPPALRMTYDGWRTGNWTNG